MITPLVFVAPLHTNNKHLKGISNNERKIHLLGME